MRRWTAADRPPPPFVRLRNRELLFWKDNAHAHTFNLSFLAVNGEYGAEKSWGEIPYPTYFEAGAVGGENDNLPGRRPP